MNIITIQQSVYNESNNYVRDANFEILQFYLYVETYNLIQSIISAHHLFFIDHLLNFYLSSLLNPFQG